MFRQSISERMDNKTGAAIGRIVTVIAAVFAAQQFLATEALAQQAPRSAFSEATVVAPKNCTITCTLQDEKYSLYATERCLNSLNAKELEKFKHQCIAKLERERKRPEQIAQQKVKGRCKSNLARPAQTSELREHLKNCDNPLTTDEYHREVQQWLKQAQPTTEDQEIRRIKEFKNILAREQERQVKINRERN